MICIEIIMIIAISERPKFKNKLNDAILTIVKMIMT